MHMNRNLLLAASVLSVSVLSTQASLATAGASSAVYAAGASPAVRAAGASPAVSAARGTNLTELAAAGTLAAVRHCKFPARQRNSRGSGIVTVTIVTVPVSPAARFSLDGHPLVTDAKGIAAGNANCSIAKHVVKLLNPTIGTDQRFSFVRWAGPVDHEQQHRNVIDDLTIRRDVTLQAGFNVTYGLKYRFVNPAGRSVPLTRVTAMTVRASSGSQQRTTGGQIRLSGLAVRQSGSRLVSSPVIQRIERVDIDGSNAVFASEQKFSPDDVWRKKQTLTVPVLLFSIHIDARSRIRKQPVGTALLLTYPNGRIARSPMQHGKLTLDNLVRGEYVVNVETPGGLRVARPVRLSSSQYLNLTVLTADDKNILIIAGLLLVAALIAMRLVSRRGAKRRTTSSSTSIDV